MEGAEELDHQRGAVETPKKRELELLIARMDRGTSTDRARAVVLRSLKRTERWLSRAIKEEEDKAYSARKKKSASVKKALHLADEAQSEYNEADAKLFEGRRKLRRTESKTIDLMFAQKRVFAAQDAGAA